MSICFRESPEREEFLPHKSDGGKPPQFTDVSAEIKVSSHPDHINKASSHKLFPGYLWLLFFWLIVFFPASLKERRHLECLSSTLAMLSWVVGFWDCPTPCPTLVSSSFCEYSRMHLKSLSFTTKHNVNVLEVCRVFLENV